MASSSGRYDRPEDIVGLWLATITAVIVWVMFPREPAESGNWSAGSVSLGVLIMVIGVVIVGSVCGSRVSWLRRLFSPTEQLQEEVAARARGVFFDNRIHHTVGSTGLLIYVSLFEHMAVVLGDQEALEKIGQPSMAAAGRTCLAPKIVSVRCREMKSSGGNGRFWRAVSPVFHGDLSSAEFFAPTATKKPTEWSTFAKPLMKNKSTH